MVAGFRGSRNADRRGVPLVCRVAQLVLFVPFLVYITPLLAREQRGRPHRICTVRAPWAEESFAEEVGGKRGTAKAQLDVCRDLPEDVVARLREQTAGPIPLKFASNDKRILTTTRPWVLLIDSADKREIRRVLPSPEYLD